MVAQAPEHVIENLKLAEKSARDGKKTVKRQPPEKNFVNWDKNTFNRLVAAPPERFRIGTGDACWFRWSRTARWPGHAAARPY